MIFKTYENNIDHISSKWGILGQSFHDIGTAAIAKISDIIKGLQTTDGLIGAIKSLDGIWERLYPNQESIKNQLYDVDRFIPEINKYGFDFDYWINQLNDTDKKVRTGTLSWQDYSDSLAINQKWIAKWGQETEGQIRTQGDLIKANQQARASALAHNEAIKAQTLSVKAGKAAFQAFAAVGNMLASAFIEKGIQSIIKAIDRFIHQSQYAIKAMEDAKQTISDSQSRLKNVSSTISETKERFLELSEGVGSFSENISLSEAEYAEYLSISDRLAALSPSLVSGYTDQGNALLHIGNTAEETSAKLNQVLEAEQALAQQTLVDNMGDIANGVYHQVKDAKDRIDSLESQLKLYSQSAENPEYLDHLIQRVDDNTMSVDLDTARGLDFDEIQQLRNLILHSGARVVTFKGHDSLSFAAADYELVNKAIEDFYSRISYTERNENAAYINGLEKDILEQKNIIRDAYSSMNPVLSTWVQGTYEYEYLDEAQQKLIDALVPNLDWSQLSIELGKSTFDEAEYEQYIRDQILTPLMSIYAEQRPLVNEKIAQLFQFEPGDINLVDSAAELEAYLSGIGVTIDLTPLLGNTPELKKQYEQILSDAAYRFIENDDKDYSRITEERETLEDFAEKNSINTQDEIAFWKQCIEESDTREEAMEKYLSSSFVNGGPSSPLTISETVDQINTRLKSAFGALRSAYQGIFTLDENTGENLFTPLDEANITDKFQPILDALKSLDELDGINVDYSSYEDFVSVLSDTSSTAEDVQEQFDRLATNIIYTSDCTDMSAETFSLLAKSLSEMGVANAYEVLNSILALQESLSDEGIDVETAMNGEAEALKDLTFASDETAERLMAYYIQKQLAENPITTAKDLLQLENLCNALGITGEMLETITALKLAFEAKENGAHAAGLEESIKHYQERLSELSAGYGSFAFDFDGTNAKLPSSSGSAASRSTAETFDWISQAIEHLEKEIEKLDETANSSFTTFSEKNEAFAQEIRKVSDEIGLQQQAYDNYIQKADAAGLSDHYKDLAENGASFVEDISDETLKNQIKEYQKWYDKAQEAQDKINSLYEKSKEIHVASYENCVNELNTLRDNDSISEREYLDRMNTLWESYYADRTEYAVQAKEAKLELLKEEKSYLESVADAAADLLGGQADELKRRQEAEIEILEAKKRPLEAQLELLESQKEEEDRILALQKAQYELKRAEHQRDKLTYVDGQMVYRADETSIRSAKDAVDDAEYNIIKADIKDRIDAYDKEIDKIKERYETEIAGIECLEDEWQKALALKESALTAGNFESMFGEGSIAKLLSGDPSMITTWKQTYLETLGGIDLTGSGTIGEMTARYAELAGLDLSSITEQTRTVASQFNAVHDAVGRLNASIGSEPVTDVPDGTSREQTLSSDDSLSLSGALQNTYDIASEVLPEEADMLNAITLAANNAAAAIHELKTAISSLSALPLDPDSLAVSGNAYATGTRHAKKGLAMIGEERPEIIITNDQKAYLAKQPTLLHMEGGETVYNGEETAKMLKARGLKPVTPDKFPLLKAFGSYRPSEIRQRFAPQMISPAGTAAASAIQNAGHAVNNSVNNGTSYTTGDVHIHCPGITKDEVAKQIGTELTNVFSGMSLNAYQRANITR